MNDAAYDTLRARLYDRVEETQAHCVWAIRSNHFDVYDRELAKQQRAFRVLRYLTARRLRESVRRASATYGG